jgi:hypothetical protein
MNKQDIEFIRLPDMQCKIAVKTIGWAETGEILWIQNHFYRYDSRMHLIETASGWMAPITQMMLKQYFR